MKSILLLTIVLLSGQQICYSQLTFTELSASETSIDFQNILTESPQVNTLTYQYYHNGGGVCVGDINNDGLPDLYFVSNQQPNRLYLNKGGMRFEDISAVARVTGEQGWATGATMIDINNDGLLDIYVCKSGNVPPEMRKNKLYINNGDLTFSEKSSEYGIDDSAYSTQAYFLDYDLDGDLDMYLLNHPINSYTPSQEGAASFDFPRDPLAGDKLFQNNNGKFLDVSKKAGIKGSPIGFGLSVSVGDMNNDGYPDMYVCNDFLERDYLYINNRNGTFTDKLVDNVRHISNYSMGSDIADINNDGLLDIMVADMAAEGNFRSKTNMSGMNPERFWNYVNNGFHYQYMINTLQLNNGNAQFSEISQLAGVDKTDWSWAPLMADFNQDGLRDLFMTNGLRKEARNNDFVKKKEAIMKRMQRFPDSTLYYMREVLDMMPEQPISNYLYQNKGGLLFTKEGNSGMENPTFSNGAAYGDLDGDGDLDLVVNNIDQKASVYRNDSKGGSFVKIKLNGSPLNKSGIGAKITVVCGADIQTSEHYLARGYQSSIQDIVHFGLGNAKKIDLIEVAWSDGTISHFKNLGVNQLLNLDAKDELVSRRFDREKNYLKMRRIELGVFSGENKFNDFEREVLLPHKMSEMGPGIDVADVNGDGLEDFYVGGALGFNGGLFVQKEPGKFVNVQPELGEINAHKEETVAHFFDFDGDGDSDLYIGNGGNEALNGDDLLKDAIYENVNGTLEVKDMLPAGLNYSTGCVSSYDFDNDGDLDLFVGNRQTPGKYPYASKSYILINEGDKFVESSVAGIGEIGMVTNAEWVDLNGDKQVDLILSGEWMAITVLIQNKGRFVNKTKQYGLNGTEGWWFGLATGDIDNDGDIDIIGGNLGLNYKYSASKEGPFQIYSDDINGDNKNDIVLGYNQEGKNYPLRGRQCSSEQIPELTDAFPNYNLFATATLEEVYGESLDSALNISITDFNSAVFINEGSSFKRVNFAHDLQISNWNDIILEDINADGNLDVIAAGNLHGAEVETPRCDAGNGLILIGNGKGGFQKIESSDPLWGNGNTKSLKSIAIGIYQGVLVGRSNGDLEIIVLGR